MGQWGPLEVWDPLRGVGGGLGCWEGAGSPGRGVRLEVGALEMWLGDALWAPRVGARWDEPPLGEGDHPGLAGAELGWGAGWPALGLGGGGRETSGPTELHLAASGGGEVKALPSCVWWVRDGRKVLLGNC